MKNELSLFYNRKDEDVTIWLKRWTFKKEAEGRTDDNAIKKAVLHFGEGAFERFLMHGVQVNTWDAFWQFLPTSAAKICR